MAQYIVKKIGETVTLGLLLTKNGEGLTGLSPTVEIRRNVDGRYFDFAAVSTPYWKTSGGQKEKILPERVWLSGYYTWVFDHATYDNIENEDTVIYRNLSPYRLVEVELVAFESNTLADVEYIRKILTNKQTLEQLAQDHYHHEVFDDDKITPIYEADITMTGGILETRDPL